jgi:hypothetical protein
MGSSTKETGRHLERDQSSVRRLHNGSRNGLLTSGFTLMTAAVSAFGGMLNAWLPFGEPLAKMMDFAISFGVVTLVFAMIFKILPDVKLAWSDVWTGGIDMAPALFRRTMPSRSVRKKVLNKI